MSASLNSATAEKVEVVEAEIVEDNPAQALANAGVVRLPVVGPTSSIQPMSVEDAVTDRLLRDPSLPVEHVKEVLALRTQLYEQRRQERLDQAREEFFENLAKAQNEMKRVITNRENTHTRSQYATYAQIDKMARPIYTKYGFSVTFNTRQSDAPDYVITTAQVTRGLWTQEYETPPLRADGKGPRGDSVMTQIHAAGSAKSYGRRYLIIDIFNIAISNDPHDDDGNAASGNGPSGTISAEQVETIKKLIEETKTDLKLFLEYGGVEKIEDIPANQFRDAVAKLMVKKHRKVADKLAEDK